ncbi:hypothetical protein [Mariniblastus fucicola]|uniref:Uncharacterized protein n=1 Tax=Mariniblastus fucicola TaxID=980251 RepID=A0A5B9P3I4_9BACT|nr:hypothetical protein [Mariniblastus fucicola]QEG21137.1 hypothetical protein MFFC18_09910 [Mariniblastus fucicola]
MFPTKENTENHSGTGSAAETSVEQTFESIEQFASWLDSELDVLVEKFAEFETDKSVRKFFKRS